MPALYPGTTEVDEQDLYPGTVEVDENALPVAKKPVPPKPAPAIRKPGDYINPRWRVGVDGKPFLTPEAVGAAPPIQTIGKQLGQGWEDINKPLIPLGRDTTEQETAGMGPVLKSAIGAGEASKHFTESLTSPLSIATLGAGGALMKAYPILSRALAGVFGATMAKQAAEEVGDLAGIPKDQRDAKTIAKHLTSIALTGGTAALALYEAALRKSPAVQAAEKPQAPPIKAPLLPQASAAAREAGVPVEAPPDVAASAGLDLTKPASEGDVAREQARRETAARRQRVPDVGQLPEVTIAGKKLSPEQTLDLLSQPQAEIGGEAATTRIKPVADPDLAKPIGTVSVEVNPEKVTPPYEPVTKPQGKPNASSQPSATSTTQPEIWSQVGETPPLRQQGEAAGARPPQGEGQAPSQAGELIPTAAAPAKPLPSDRIAEASAGEMRAMAKQMGRDLGSQEPEGMWIKIGDKEFLFINKDLSPSKKAEVKAHELKHREVQAAIEAKDSRFDAAQQIVEHVQANPDADPNLHNLIKALGEGYKPEDIAKELLADGWLDLDRAKGDLADLKAGKHANQEGLIVRRMMEKKAEERAASTKIEGRQNEEPKAPWQIPFNEFKQGGSPKGRARIHRESVETAVRMGLPVPTEVLADYPELKPSVAKPLPSPEPIPAKPVSAKSAQAEPAPEEQAVQDDMMIGMGGALRDLRGESFASQEKQLMDALAALRSQPGTQSPGDRIKAADRIAQTIAAGKGFFADWALRIKAGTEQYKRLLFGPTTEEGPFWSPKKDWAAARQVNAGVAREMIQKAKADYPRQLTRQGMGKFAEALMFDDPAAKLAEWASTAKPQYKAQYVAALKLTPEQIQAARQAVQYYEAKGMELQQMGLLNNLIEDYAGQHMVDRPGKPPQELDTLKADLVSGKLNTNFKYAMKRVFQTEYDLEQAGYKLKTSDLFDKLANYALSAENVLADRAVVKEWMKGETADGKPFFSTGQQWRELTSKKYAVVKEGQDRALRVFEKPEDAQQFAKANGGTVQERANPALLVNPKVRPHPSWKDASGKEQDISGEYVHIDHPAFKKWQWAETEPDGKQVFVQGDVWAHKSIADELKNTFGRSQLYGAIPYIGAATRLNAEMKGMKLVGAFHQVKTGIHALSHLVSPWGQPEVDVHSPETYDALRSGLQLFESNKAEMFSEGLASGSWLQWIANRPAMLNERLNFGDRLRDYQECLFQDYIPRIKMATYRAALGRNVERFGKTTDLNTIKQWTAIQVNSGFGELNWRLMGTNPTFRHTLQLSLLAPDFQAAQHGFMAQMFTKMGKENRMSAGIMVAAIYTGSRILNQIFDDNPHMELKNAFAVRIGNRWYSVRTVPGDAMRAMTTPLNYVRARIAPVLSTVIEALSKTSSMGRKETGTEVAKNIAERFIPLPFSQQAGAGFVEHALTSTFGVREKRASNITDTQGMATEWRKKNDPSWRDEGAVQYPESQYKPLREALADDDMATAVREYHKLIVSGHDPEKIEETMRPRFFTSTSKDATAKDASRQKEEAFKKSLTAEQRKTYDKAVRERQDIYYRFTALDKR